MTNTKLNNTGSILVISMLILLSAIVIASTGIYVSKGQVKEKPSENSISVIEEPSTFIECIRSGNEVLYIQIPKNSGYEDPLVDYSLSGTRCETATRVYYPSADDVQCNNQTTCDDIMKATQTVCATETGNNNLKPTFQFHPVTKGDYSRLYLSDCSDAKLRNERVITLLLNKTDNTWQITHKLAEFSCNEAEKANFPLELFSECWRQQ